MESSPSEVSLCCDGKHDRIPLKVALPPETLGSETVKVLTIDQDGQINCQEKPASGSPQRSLNIEEFECGVQIESRESSKQEWSFTLYDFDGQGKITKEDLASLLKALYDAVGSSIKLPDSGTKSLKLRLTVGPDNSQIQADIKADVKSSPVKTSKAKDSATASKESPSVVKPSDNVQTYNLPKDLSKLNNLLLQTSRHPHTPKCNIEKQQQQQQAAAQQQQQQQAKQQTGQGNRIKLSTHDHQHLAELVQQNMERNHVRHLRRQHSDCRGSGHHEHSHQKRKHRSSAAATCQNNQTDERPRESQDRRNYYLDLAGVENNTSKFQTTSEDPAAALLTPTSPHRGRTQDAACKYHDNLKKDSAECGTRVTNSKIFENVRFDPHVRSRSFDPQEVATQRSPKSQSKVTQTSSPGTKFSRFRPVSLPSQVPEAVSPHYHRRHRHREKDHDLAMQQVAEWIERQHTWDEDGKKLVVQRHEHHHVHEHHHHHHYHHYYEA